MSVWWSVYCPVLLLRIIALLTRGDNAVKRHLAHDQENDQSHSGPYDALLEGNLGLGDLDLGDKRGEWLHQVEETDCAGGVLTSILDGLLGRSIGAIVAVVAVSCEFNGDTYGHS